MLVRVTGPMYVLFAGDKVRLSEGMHDEETKHTNFSPNHWLWRFAVCIFVKAPLIIRILLLPFLILIVDINVVSIVFLITFRVWQPESIIAICQQGWYLRSPSFRSI